MLIYLIDLAHESKLGLGSDSMPLQLGLIGAYCKKEVGDSVEIQIFKYVREFVEAMKRRRPTIVASSNYIWNMDLGYQYLARIKREYPEILTVFGGPNYPDEPVEQIEWLIKFPFIDVYIHKDGEIPFAQLVKYFEEFHGDIRAVQTALLPSCHSFVEGNPYFGKTAPRFTDLTVTPSPYTTGLMDKFFDAKLIPTIQTNRGCPFKCTFCTEGGDYYTRVYRTSTARKKEEIEYIVARIKHTKTLRITDSNFGMFREDVEFCQFLHEVQRRTGFPEYVSCSAGKNQKERILACNGLLGGAMRLAASVQSLDPDVLTHIGRTNISLGEIMSLADQIGETDTHSYSELILGLPLDSLEKEKKSMGGLVCAGIGNITQHQLALIYGTELASSASRARYGLKSKFRPIQRCVGVYPWHDDQFYSVEIEEICVENSTMTFSDYLEARRLYLTVGLFYNDRVFGEINALLRFLQFSTWEWLLRIHQDFNKGQTIQLLYDEFTKETLGELWDKPAQLALDVTANINRYIKRGEAGGNLIYKYRSRGLIGFFTEIHTLAFRHLAEYLRERGAYHEALVADVKKLSWYSKRELLDFNLNVELKLDFDLVEMIHNPLLAREKKPLSTIQEPTKVRIAHTPQQIDTIQRQLAFFGSDLYGMTMLMSRFPIRRFYRKVSKI